MGTTQNYRCIAYQRDDPDAVDEPGRPQAERERTMWHSVYSTPEMIENARGSTHGCIDAKWCTCSDGSPRTALLVGSGRTEPKPGEAPIPESSTGGYTHYDMDPVVVITSNRDNYFCPRIAVEFIRRMMPRDDPACSHSVVRKEQAHGRGFWLETACSGNQEDFSPVVTIDKAKGAARGLKSLGLIYLLCTFHAYAAMLKWFTEQGIKESSMLVSLLYCAWFMARGRTVADVKRRWERVKAAVLPRLGLNDALVKKIRKYGSPDLQPNG